MKLGDPIILYSKLDGDVLDHIDTLGLSANNSSDVDLITLPAPLSFHLLSFIYLTAS